MVAIIYCEGGLSRPPTHIGYLRDAPNTPASEDAPLSPDTARTTGGRDPPTP
jgi:hypothetical protein